MNKAFLFINKEVQRVDKEALVVLDGKDIMTVFPEQSKKNKTVLVLKTPKTESSVRKVFLPRSVANQLIEWKKEQEKLKEVFGEEYKDYNLVMATTYGSPVGDSSIRKKMDCRSNSLWLAKRKGGENMNKIRKLSEMTVYLKQTVEMYSQHDYEQLHQELRARYNQLIMEAFMDRHPGWSVVEGNAACMMYIYRNWSFSRKAKENAVHLSALADDIAENFEECDDAFLTAEAAAETMKVAEHVYNFSKRVMREQHMFIFLFQAKHRTEDSFCRFMNMADGSVAADIYMLIPHKDHEATPQSMLLHELGHCVNITLTGNSEVPPKDFVLVTSLIGVNQADYDVPEFFAHCFAMSLLIEPDLVSADPFNTVSQNHKQMFRTYFQHKIQNL